MSKTTLSRSSAKSKLLNILKTMDQPECPGEVRLALAKMRQVSLEDFLEQNWPRKIEMPKVIKQQKQAVLDWLITLLFALRMNLPDHEVDLWRCWIAYTLRKLPLLTPGIPRPTHKQIAGLML